MADFTVRWAGSSDAASGSTYQIERTLDWSTWTELAAAQAATSPYESPANTLAADATNGDTTIDLTDGTDFSSSGYGFIGASAMVQWTGKSTNQLTGVTWHSGYGTWTSGSNFVEAHESIADTGVTPSNLAVVYRITHTNPSSEVSPPSFFWHFYPSTPPSNEHCIVLISVFEDLGLAPRAGVTIRANLASDDGLTEKAGQHLDQATATNHYEQTTNNLGLVELPMWKDSVRFGVDTPSVVPKYQIVLDPAGEAYTITLLEIPDANWVLAASLSV